MGYYKSHFVCSDGESIGVLSTILAELSSEVFAIAEDCKVKG